MNTKGSCLADIEVCVHSTYPTQNHQDLKMVAFETTAQTGTAGNAKGIRIKSNNGLRLAEASRVSTDDDFAVLSLRNFLFDICNQNGGGHGGSALGMAAIGVALYKYVMSYNPEDADWFDRDRFVLSNGKK
jgi:hypothetical protein